jgi:hypothetical protein
VSPCFFIPGPAAATSAGLRAALDDEPMIELRRAIRAGQRRECESCVCSMWREPIEIADLQFPRWRHARV